MERKNIAGESPWEDIVGYSRAVVIGKRVEVAGTTAMKDGEVQFPGDVERQTRIVFELIEEALKKAGSSMDHVVRTRMYVTNIADWERVGRVHGEFFKSIKPAATMVEVSALIDRDLKIEIEVEAVMPN